MSKTEQMVYITGWRTGRKYHTDEDCNKLQRAQITKEVPLSRYQTYELCSYCDPDYNIRENKGNEQKHPCPVCEKKVKRLHTHLPCHE